MNENRKTVVIKFGGSLFTNSNNRLRFWEDVKSLILKNYKVVIVHGGGKEISSWLEKLGTETKFVNGLRWTDEKSMEIVEMVLSGKVNKQLVSELSQLEILTVGISGRDSNLVKAKEILELGRVGEPISAEKVLLEKLLNANIVPIISPISADDLGNSLNVNADDFADIIAQSLNADNLIFMTDMKGVMKDINDENSVINVLTKDVAEDFIKNEIIKGGMIPKIRSAFNSLDAGVGEVNIVDGREFGIISKIFDENLKNILIGTRIIK